MYTMKDTDMQSKVLGKRQPLIPSKVVATTFVTFFIFTLVFFHYDAYANGLGIAQVNVGNMLVMLFTPVAISLFAAPVIALIRNETFMDAFKPVLFLTALAGISYLLYLMLSGQGFY